MIVYRLWCTSLSFQVSRCICVFDSTPILLRLDYWQLDSMKCHMHSWGSSLARKCTPLNSIVSPFHSSQFFRLHTSETISADEGGATRMSGGIPALTLPAGYLGSSFIGACLITCGFDTNASKVASLVLAVFFLFTLWWARRNLLWAAFVLIASWLPLTLFSMIYSTWVLIVGMSGIIVLFWFVAQGVALRYFVRDL